MEKNKGPWQRNTIMMIFSGREDEHKRRHKNGQTRISLDIYGKKIKINTFTFACMVMPLDPHWFYT